MGNGEGNSKYRFSWDASNKTLFHFISSISFNSQENPSLNIRLCGYTIKMHKTEVLTIRIGTARDKIKVEVPTIFCLIFDQWIVNYLS